MSRIFEISYMFDQHNQEKKMVQYSKRKEITDTSDLTNEALLEYVPLMYDIFKTQELEKVLEKQSTNCTQQASKQSQMIEIDSD